VAVMAACKELLETNVVGRAEPFHSTVEDDTKLAPVTANVKPAPPTIAEPGVNNVIADTAVVVVNVRAAEVPPPGEGGQYLLQVNESSVQLLTVIRFCCKARS
jgi:hypothetical protein